MVDVLYPNVTAPVQFRQSTGGRTVPLGPQAKSTDHFAVLWNRMAINKFTPQNDYEVLPYDTYCPIMKSAVKKRVCDLCGMYYSSMAAVKTHKSD